MTVIKINEENLLAAVTKGSAILAFLFSVTGLVVYGIPMALGISAGSAIAVVNFIWQKNIMQRVLVLQTGRPTVYATMRYLLRLGITGILIYLILISGYFSVAGLLVGLSVVVIMIVICTVYFSIQHKGD